MAPPVVLIGLDPVKYTNGHVSYLIAHALAAKQAGFSPQIFCYGPVGGNEELEFGTVHRVATPLRHFLLAPVNTRPIAKAIAEYLSGCGHAPPHVVHGFGTWAGAAVAGAAQAARGGVAAIPVVSAYTTVAHEWRGLLRSMRLDRSARAAVFHLAWYPWVATAVARAERRGCERAQLVLVNYHSVARLLREAYGPELRIRRVPYAAATAFGDPSGSSCAPTPAVLEGLQPAEAPLILSIARHSPNKGVEVLLRALADLDRLGVRFRACVVGPGRLLGAHRGLTARLGLNDRVALPGAVDSVLPYLEHADVFVLPSLEEGSGSVALLEALQVGLPVVASSCDGIPEDVTDGHDALLVPPGDVIALRDALADIIANPNLRARLAAQGRELFERRFSAAPFAAVMRDVYAELGLTPGVPAVHG